MNRKLIPILLLFAGSGCAALIYEVVWYQQLQLVLGSTTVSLAILLATFMGGLCLGSLALPRFPFPGRNPLVVFAGVECGIALGGLVVKFLLPVVSRAYFSGTGSGLLAALLMLPATVFMGASFPAIARWVRGEAASSWALLYGSNTVGAVAGCLLAGFYLLRVYNMATAAWVACGLNLAVAGLSYLLGQSEAVSENAEAAEPAAGASAPLWAIYLTIGLSGFCALGAEVIWTRLLSMLFLGTVYIFSAILAVFLIGLAIGGALSSGLMRRRADPAMWLGLCQLFLAGGIAYSAYMILRVLPVWSRAVISITDPWKTLSTDLSYAAAAILPSAILWGASFPLACAAALRRGNSDAAGVTGRVYAANTLGAIAGALIVSLALVPNIGSQDAQKWLLVLCILATFPVVKHLGTTGKIIAVCAGLCLLLRPLVPAVPSDMIAYGRNMADMKGRSELLWMHEGLNSSVAYTRWGNGTVYINVNGHVEATSEDFDMRLQRMVGHLPLLLHGHAKSVLGIGFGAGVSAGTFTRYPSVEHITVCEIEPAIPPNSNRFFGPQNYHVFEDKRTRIQFDDARHYLMTTKDKYDVIASDPLDVFIKGTAALYTAEYFEAVKKRLNPGGYFSLYVPLYETDEPTIKSELETFFRVFPNATVWSNTRDGLGYDLVFLGQAEPFRVNLDEAQARLDGPEYARVRESLLDIGFRTSADLFGTYLGGAEGLHPWTQGAEINSDGDLRLSYLAGLGINAAMANEHYVHMLKYRRNYLGLFEGSAAAKNALQDAILRQTP